MPPVCSNRPRRSSASGDAEPARDARQVPHRLDRDLGHAHVARPGQHGRRRAPAARPHRLGDLRHVDVRAGDRDGRPHVQPGRQLVGEHFGDQMAPRVERDDRVAVRPLRERADGDGRARVGQVRPVRRVELAGGDRQRAIDRVGAGMRADGVALGRGRQGGDDRAAAARRPPRPRPPGGARPCCADATSARSARAGVFVGRWSARAGGIAEWSMVEQSLRYWHPGPVNRLTNASAHAGRRTGRA